MASKQNVAKSGVPRTFKEFILALPDWNNPAGDFIRDARADKRMPAVQSWLDLRAYLDRSGAWSAVYPAAFRVWSAYEALVLDREIRASERAFGKTAPENAIYALEAAEEAELEELTYLFADAVAYADDSEDAKIRKSWRPVKKLVEKRLRDLLSDG